MVILCCIGGKKPLGEHAAVWVPDAEADICMHCNKSQFNVINRRHHCRKCGAVVCGPCSNKRYLLPIQSSKPLRVCLTCYDVLSKAKNHETQNSSLNRKMAHFPFFFHFIDKYFVILDDTSVDSSGEDDSEDDDNSLSRSNEVIL